VKRSPRGCFGRILRFIGKLMVARVTPPNVGSDGSFLKP
jgi:hypothetical protein